MHSGNYADGWKMREQAKARTGIIQEMRLMRKQGESVEAYKVKEKLIEGKEKVKYRGLELELRITDEAEAMKLLQERRQTGTKVFQQTHCLPSRCPVGRCAVFCHR